MTYQGASGRPIITSVIPGRRKDPRPAADRGVRSILCLKLDHIGDLLIAAPALMLLRRSFPQAHITLVCGPWNVGLARRLQVADTVVSAAIFSQNSAADLDPAARRQRQAAAIAELQAQDLGPFDLAVDLRRDDDTRELLKLFPARIYAGFGDLQTFSYLDVALPFTRHGVHSGPSSLRLGPQDLGGGMGHRISGDGLHLTALRGRIDLEVATDAVWPPTDDDIPDTRPLGAALYRIDIHQADATGGVGSAELARDAMSFGSEWLDWEPWGRWSSTALAPVALEFPASGPEVELLVRVQGHTAAPHPQATVRLSAGGASAAHTFHTGDEPATLRLSCRAQVSPPTASSAPVLLRAGRYQGVLRVRLPEGAEWTPLTLTVRGSRPRIVAKLTTPPELAEHGELSFPFELEHRDTAEPLVVEIASESLSTTTEVAILAVELECLQARSPTLPVVHMETQLMDLAAMVALRFAPELVTAGEAVADNLSRPVEGSTAATAVQAIRARREGRRVFGLKTPDRRIIGIGLGANKETKRWPDAYFLELCRRLLTRRGVDLAFLGGPKEAEDVRALVAQLAAPERVLDLCSCCRIEDLGEVLAELDGFIGLDTGTTHFAGRVGVKTLALFGVSHDPMEWGPVGGKSAWAGVEMACSSCSKSELAECEFGLQCMVALKPDDVWPLVEKHLL